MTRTLDSLCYKKHFLREVIGKVEFLNPLTGVEEALPKRVSGAALSNFAIAEPRVALQRQVQLRPDGIESEEQELKQWYFHSKDRTKTLMISQQAVYVQHTAYQKYDLLRDELLQVLRSIQQEYDDQPISRAGLRFVNSIELKEADPMSWSAYLTPELLAVFQLPEASERPALARVFHNMELTFETFNLRYLFGMHNPDFPARIRQKVFILDLDAYTPTATALSEIPSLMDTFHEAIQRYFENSITDTLRGVMNAE